MGSLQALARVQDFKPGVLRRWDPRFQGEAFEENLKLVGALK